MIVVMCECVWMSSRGRLIAWRCSLVISGIKDDVGTALVANLKNIKENKNRTRPNLQVDEIYEYDLDSKQEELDFPCRMYPYQYGASRGIGQSLLYPGRD